jgi:hypothetical protein
MLTHNEKMLIADALNGCPLTLDAMCGSDERADYAPDAMDRIEVEGLVTSGLEHEIYDAIRLNGLDKKWHVNAREMLNKIARMTRAQRESLVRRVAEVWERNDSNFEKDLLSLEV